MPFKLTELYAELTVKGQGNVADALAGIRREMIKTQRIVNALGGEMTAGLTFANSLAARALRRDLEPTLKGLQRQTLANLGALRQWSPAQMAAIQGIAAFINKLGSVEYHLGEYQKHLEGVFRISKLTFGGGTAAILGLGAAASPQAIETLTSSFKWLAAEVGTAFVPVIAKAALTVQTMARAFHDLSPGTKDFIAKWGTIAVIIGGVGVAANALIFIYTGLSAAIRGVAAAYAFMATAAKTAATTSGFGAGVGLGAGAGAGLGLGTGLATTGGGAAAGMGGMKLLQDMRRVKVTGATATGVGAIDLGTGLPMGGAAAAGGAGLFSKLGKFGPALKIASKWFLIVGAITEGADLVSRLWNANSGGLSGSNTSKAVRSWLLDLIPFRKSLLPDIGRGKGDLSFDQKKDLLLSPFGKPQMGDIDDAWKQAQMAAMRGTGPEGEALKLQYDNNLYLQQIAANTRPQGVGPK